jgi:hypothetical protein
MAALLGILVVLAMGALVFLGYSRGHVGGTAVALTIVFGLLPAFFLLVLGSALASVLLRDVVAPLQWGAGLSCSDAIRAGLGLVRQHAGAFALYLALKVAFGLALGVVLLVAGCLTCCLAWVPVVGQTLLQPLFFFERAWSLRFVRQLGCDVFPKAAPVDVSPAAGL